MTPLSLVAMTTFSRFGIGFEEAAKELLAGAGRVDIGGVEEVDSEIEGLLEEGLAVCFAESPGVAAGTQGS